MYCPECDFEMVFEERIYNVKHLNLQQDVLVSAYWCNNCGDVVLRGEALRQVQKARAAIKEILAGKPT